MLLTVIGIYGIFSYAIAKRAHQMGVRMALGATPAGLRVELSPGGALAARFTPDWGSGCGNCWSHLTRRFLKSLVDGAAGMTGSIVAARPSRPGSARSMSLVSARAVDNLTVPRARHGRCRPPLAKQPSPPAPARPGRPWRAGRPFHGYLRGCTPGVTNLWDHMPPR